MAGIADAPAGNWLTVLRRFCALIVVANLIWEIGQLPFYTIWRDGSAREIIVAIAHCTAGDAIIALTALLLAIVCVGDRRWPHAGFGRVLMVAAALGLLYTVFSEWLNVINRKSWAYSILMPTVPWIGTGLTPLLQWLILPASCLSLARLGSRRRTPR